MNTTTDKLLFTASGVDPLLTPDAATAVRAFASSMTAEITSLVDQLAEPFKGQFLEIKGQVNQMLASLPLTDAVLASQESNCALRSLFSALQTAQSMISSLTSTAKKVSGDLVATRASLPTDIQTAIDAQVTAGTLFTKEAAQSLAKDAVTAARVTFQNEQRAISDRRTSLSSASIPVPNDAVLIGDDADFAAKQVKATARLEKLKAFNLSSARLVHLTWEKSDSEFDSTLEILTEAGAPKKAAGSPNPLVAPAKPLSDVRSKVGAL